jgi:hypothetical protein
MARYGESFVVGASLEQTKALFDQATAQFKTAGGWSAGVSGSLTKTVKQGWGLFTNPATIEIRIVETEAGCHVSLEASSIGFGPIQEGNLRKEVQEARAAVERAVTPPATRRAPIDVPVRDEPGRPRAGVAHRLFVSYRREDSADVTGRICDALEREFGADAIFRDVDSIPLGVDFRQHLGAAIEQCHVVLAIIGRDWTGAAEPGAPRRIDDPSDFVRVEIESAIQRQIPVIPLLVNRAVMLTADQLPAPIAALAYRNGMPIRHDPDFKGDVARLCKELRTSLGSRTSG